MTDLEIVDGLKAGEPGAFRALYQSLGTPVHGYLCRVLGRRELAEELTQEAFLLVCRKIAFFEVRSGEGGLKAWVFRIATHLAIDVLRRERRMELTGEEPEPEAPAADSPEAQFEAKRFREELEQALLLLTPAQRMIFLLKEQEGMTALAISRVCGCSLDAVKQSLVRARAQLRKRLCE